MNELENDCLSLELLSDIEKIKIEMILSHIILSRLSGQNSMDYQSWTSLKKRRYIYRLYKSGILIKTQSKISKVKLNEQSL